jgi:hypothetical protein
MPNFDEFSKIENWLENDLIEFININKEERRNLEFKSGKFIKEKSQEEIKKFLAKISSAFANSEGGILILGIGDGGEFNNNDLIELNRNKIRTAKWIEDIIFSNTSPNFMDFNSFVFDKTKIPNLTNEDNSGIIVIKFNMGYAAYQSVPEKVFYYRAGSASEKAPGWLVNVIANRKRAPIIDGQVHVQGFELEDKDFASPEKFKSWKSINIKLYVNNIGLVTCEKLCIKLYFPAGIQFKHEYHIENWWHLFSSGDSKVGTRYFFYTPNNIPIYPGQEYGYFLLGKITIKNLEDLKILKNNYFEYQFFAENLILAGKKFDFSEWRFISETIEKFTKNLEETAIEPTDSR